MKHVDVSATSILKLIAIPLFFYLVWMNKDLVFAGFMSLILMSALRPIVGYLTVRRKFSAPLASLLVMLVSVVVIVFLVGAIFPPIIIETSSFIERLPETLKTLDPAITRYIGVQEVSQFVPSFANQLVTIVSGVFSNTFLVFITLFMTYYLLANERVVERVVVEGILAKYVKTVEVKHMLRVFHAAQQRLASWFWGELILMISVGTACYIGFSWVGLKYALPLAVLAGLLEALPNIGPFIAGTVAVLIGFGQAPLAGVAALAVSVVVQQIENYFLVPFIMKKAVGLNPLITMLAVVLGLRLAGALGALLAIPTYVAIESVIRELSVKDTPSGNNTENMRELSEETTS